MISVNEVSDAIAEIEASRNQSPSACMRLASLYTIRDHLLGKADSEAETAQGTLPLPKGYSYSSASLRPLESATAAFIKVPIEMREDSEFLQVIDGRQDSEVWRILDDLMDTLRVTSPRAYSSVIRRLKEI